MTSEGHPVARFRRALQTGDATIALAAATELPRVALEDALALCLLVAEQDPALYPRAAARLHGRLCLEGRGIDVATAQLAAACLAALPGPHGRAAAGTLAEICEGIGLSAPASRLQEWGDRA